jgi:hypothetical protein
MSLKINLRFRLDSYGLRGNCPAKKDEKTKKTRTFRLLVLLVFFLFGF